MASSETHSVPGSDRETTVPTTGGEKAKDDSNSSFGATDTPALVSDKSIAGVNQINEDKEAPVQVIQIQNQLDEKVLVNLINALFDAQTRGQAILDLCKHMNRISYIGSMIYLRPTVLAAMLLEIVRHYPTNSGHSLDPSVNEVICAIVALLQRTVLSRDVRLPFLSTRTLSYLLPYLQQTAQTREAEQLRVSLLGLFATAASKVPVETMERYLLCLPSSAVAETGSASKSETAHLPGFVHIAPADTLYDQTVAALGTCTSEVGKTMALVLLARLLSSSRKLAQIGSDPQRFQHLISNLNSIITYMARKFERINTPGATVGCVGTDPDSPAWTLASNSFDRAKRLFRFTMDCLYRLAEDNRMRLALRVCLPIELRSRLFTVIFGGDHEVDTWLDQLWVRVKLFPPPDRVSTTRANRLTESALCSDREANARAWANSAM
ncbi:hypothetical protein D915_000337 [Fasciola hepatica]|uniref:CCR4-NOT transcription complex subunit 9 n=1 Tax=Fasciola hepatica TaxID=6192 RepID=A0A4E0S0D0_FASHE|nr:hypothetical protein D915_000337 [Fasciola hepatica]